MTRRGTSIVVMAVLLVLLAFPPSSHAQPVSSQNLMITKTEVIMDIRSDGSVGMFGSTTTANTVDYVSVRLDLQWWDGSGWVTIYRSPTYSRTDAFYVQGSNQYQLDRHGFFRLRGLHAAKDGTTSESTYTFTKTGTW